MGRNFTMILKRFFIIGLLCLWGNDVFSMDLGKETAKAQGTLRTLSLKMTEQEEHDLRESSNKRSLNFPRRDHHVKSRSAKAGGGAWTVLGYGTSAVASCAFPSLTPFIYAAVGASIPTITGAAESGNVVGGLKTKKTSLLRSLNAARGSSKN